MQVATTKSVSAIKDVGATIAQISAIAEEISTAVNAQGTMTEGIAGNIEQAAKGTSEVASNIAKVSLGAVEQAPVDPVLRSRLAHFRPKARS